MGGWGGQPKVRTHLHRHLLLVPSIEIDQKLQEIMKQTGYLTIGGQVPPSLWREREEAQPGWTHPGGASGGRGAVTEAPGTLQPSLSSQRYQAEINDLENLGEMGSGTCGQVWKMRFRKTGHVIAVKVSLGGYPSCAPHPGPVLRLPPVPACAANAALGEQGGEQAYPHGPGCGAQEP